MTDLEKAARAVLDRWESRSWEWVTYGRIAALMADLRQALAAQQAEPVALSFTISSARLTWDEAVKWAGSVGVRLARVEEMRCMNLPPDRFWSATSAQNSAWVYDAYGDSKSRNGKLRAYYAVAIHEPIAKSEAIQA